MEVQFSQDEETRLSQMAYQRGVVAAQLVKDAVVRFLNEDEQFRAAVREGIAAADRGEWISHEDVWASVEATLRA